MVYEFFSKLGSKKRQIEWLPILCIRIFSGFFFTLSGFYKLFDSSQHQIVLRTLTKAQIPFPELFAYLIPLIELLGGLFLIIGLFTTIVSFILFVILVAALIVDQIASVTIHGGILILEHFLYLPEVLYALIFFWLFFAGPGKVSLDYYFGKRRRLLKY